MKRNFAKVVGPLSLLLLLVGCNGMEGNSGDMKGYITPSTESEWIRSGEPIVFENASWYPADDVEMLTDTEVLPMGEYKGVQFFVEKTDVRPFNRLYTKFAKNQFRYFELKRNP